MGEKGISTHRLAGANRYETAVKIGEQIVNTATDTAIIATGYDYPDALSVASFAGQNGLPILFTEKDGLNTMTAQTLSKWGIQKVILVGGTGAISAQVENTLRSDMKLNVTRLSGSDRYLTALAIAKHFATYSASRDSTVSPGSNTGQQAAYSYAALATGQNFPDALAGAALAVKLKMPVLLTGKEEVSPEIRDYIQGLNLKKLYLFGGQSAIADKVLGK